MTIDDDELFAALDDRMVALRAVAADPAGYETPVLVCPGWTVADLLVHVAIIHTWAGEIITTRATERPRRPRAIPPDTELVDWVTTSSTALTAALHSANLDDEVYSFVGPRTVRFTYEARVTPPAGSRVLELWLPLPREEDQEVLDLKLDGSGGGRREQAGDESA